MTELEEFNKFKEEYEKDPVFAAYQMHTMIKVLMDIVRGYHVPNDVTQKVMEDTDNGVNVVKRANIEDVFKDLET